MNDINCPACNTTYQKRAAGFCDCCGFEFTKDYIDGIIREEERIERERLQKIAEEKRKKILKQQAEEKKRQERLKAEKEAREKEQREREERRIRAEKEKARAERINRINGMFGLFGKIISYAGIVCAALCIIVSVVFADSLNVGDGMPEGSAIRHKVENSIQNLMVSAEYNSKKKCFVTDGNPENSDELPRAFVNLYNSVSSVFHSQSPVEDKLTFILPGSRDFISGIVSKVKKTYISIERVNDYAKLISEDTERSISYMLEDAGEENGIVYLMITAGSTRGMSPEDYVSNLFSEYNIGFPQSDNTVVLLIDAEKEDFFIVDLMDEYNISAKKAKKIHKNLIEAFRADDYYTMAETLIDEIEKLVSK